MGESGTEMSRPRLRRRAIGYGAALVVAAGLLWADRAAQIPPDADHWLLQAEIKLRYAHQLPSRDATGAPVPVRQEMLREAEAYLIQADALSPGLALTAEYRAFIAYMQGDFLGAAAGYQEAARRLPTDAATGRGELAVNEARMRVLAGDDPGALAVLRAGDGVQGAAQAAAGVVEAQILERQGDRAAALASARIAAGRAGANDRAWIDACEFLERLGDDASAASAYERLSPGQPLACYFAARLKARLGESDNALEMLEHAVEGMGPELRRYVERDAELWRNVASTERFQDLVFGVPSSPPGR